MFQFLYSGRGVLTVLALSILIAPFSPWFGLALFASFMGGREFGAWVGIRMYERRVHKNCEWITPEGMHVMQTEHGDIEL